MFERLSGHFGLLALRAATREFKLLRETLQVGIDSYRQVNKLEPIWKAEGPAAAVPAAEYDPAGSNYLSVWCIEELAAEFHVPVTAEMDLEKLAIERGWMDANGKFILLPQAAGQLGPDVLAGLVGDK